MDPFATLGFERRYDLDKRELDRRYRDLQQALHPDKHVAASASERSMTLRKAMEVNEAYRVLRDDTKRAEALLAALSGEAPTTDAVADQELLMEMMELREALSEARAAHASEQVEKLAQGVRIQVQNIAQALTRAFAGLESQPVSSALLGIRALLGRLRYYQRFLDEVALFEDEAPGA
jgi:molecular chaperone HscB